MAGDLKTQLTRIAVRLQESEKQSRMLGKLHPCNEMIDCILGLSALMPGFTLHTTADITMAIV